MDFDFETTFYRCFFQKSRLKSEADHFESFFSRKVDLKVKLIILRVFFPEKST